jgi:hypothetical protein
MPDTKVGQQSSNTKPDIKEGKRIGHKNVVFSNKSKQKLTSIAVSSLFLGVKKCCED